MICPKCGSPIAEGSAFCTNCGTNLVVNPQQQYAQPQQQYAQPQQQQYAQPQQQYSQPQQQYTQPQPQQQYAQPQQQYSQPQYVQPPVQPQPYMQQYAQPQPVPEKSSNAGLIVGICIGAAGLIAGIAIILFGFVLNRDDNVQSGTSASTSSSTDMTTNAGIVTTSAPMSAETTTSYIGTADITTQAPPITGSSVVANVAYTTKIYEEDSEIEVTGTYSGDWKNDAPDGEGSMQVTMNMEGTNYTGTAVGTWKNGLLDGENCGLYLYGEDPEFPGIYMTFTLSGTYQNGRIINGTEYTEYKYDTGSTIESCDYVDGKTTNERTIVYDADGNIINTE